MTKLDYTLESPEERKELVQAILQERTDEDLSPAYLESLGDYLVLCMEKQEKKQRKLLTENRLSTINKRETSLEGLVSSFENGEDGVYNLITENNKNALFQPKDPITEEDIANIPELQQVRQAIKIWEDILSHSSGRDAFVAKKAIIDLRKDQYVVRNSFREPVQTMNFGFSGTKYIPLENHEAIAADGTVLTSGVSLLSPKVCEAILCNYSALKENSWSRFEGDLYYLMEDFDAIATKALADYPLYERIVELKIDGVQNVTIQTTLEEEFGITHSLEYISSLWRNKIPKLIASAAEDAFLSWYYLEVEKGTYKRCTRCGQIKLAHNKYFSKNKTSKDGWYSICKCCRNASGQKS